MQWLLLFSTLHYSSSFEQLFFRQIVKVRVRVEEHIILLSKATVNAIWLVKWTKHVLQGAMCEKATIITIFLPEMTTHSLGPQVWMLPMVAVMWTLTAGCNGNWWFTSTLSLDWQLSTEWFRAVHSSGHYSKVSGNLMRWLIWWRHTGSLQCSANTNKDTFLSRSCVYLELYFIIT